jgi:hypothetical protein
MVIELELELFIESIMHVSRMYFIGTSAASYTNVFKLNCQLQLIKNTVFFCDRK